MTQLNLTLNENTEELFTYLSRQSNKPKSVIAKELLLENLKEKILPVLLKDYEAGKIGIKKILKMLEMTPEELLQKIKQNNIECPITPEIDEYTNTITEKIIQKLAPS